MCSLLFIAGVMCSTPGGWNPIAPKPVRKREKKQGGRGRVSRAEIGVNRAAPAEGFKQSRLHAYLLVRPRALLRCLGSPRAAAWPSAPAPQPPHPFFSQTRSADCHMRPGWRANTTSPAAAAAVGCGADAGSAGSSTPALRLPACRRRLQHQGSLGCILEAWIGLARGPGKVAASGPYSRGKRGAQQVGSLECSRRSLQGWRPACCGWCRALLRALARPLFLQLLCLL